MSHDRGGSDQGGNPPRRPLAGGRAWRKGCRAPQRHGQGPLPPLCGAPPFAKAALEQLNTLGVNAAANPPGQRRGGPWLGLGLGQGVKRLSRGVVRRRGQLMDLAIDGGHIADRGGRLRVSGIVAQPQGMGALAVESRALVTVVRRKRAGLT